MREGISEGYRHQVTSEKSTADSILHAHDLACATMPKRELHVQDSTPDPANGLTVVIATRSQDSGSRVPTVVQSLRILGEGQHMPGHVPIQAVISEWGTGLTQSDRNSIFNAARAAEIPLSFTQADSRFRSAGHSFNEGLKAIPGYGGTLNNWVMKLDDDSIAQRDLPRRLVTAIHATGADLCGPWDVRTDPQDDLSDPAQIDKLLSRHQSAHSRIPANQQFSDLWSTLVKDGKMDLARLYATYSLGNAETDPVSPNENGLMMSPRVVNWLTQETGKLFMPELSAGEGAALFTLLARHHAAKICIDRSSIVLDRPSGGLDQEFFWGRGDAEFALNLKKAGILRSGMTITTINPVTERAELISVPDMPQGIVVYPHYLKLVCQTAESMGQDFWDGCTHLQQERGLSGLHALKTWLPVVDRALASPSRRVEHVFNSRPPVYSASNFGELRSILLHISGGVLALSDAQEHSFIIARGSL